MTTLPADDFVRPTTGFWQSIVGADALGGFTLAPPYRYGFPARLPDGRFLVLPIRKVAGQEGRAVASLIANQASLGVVRELSTMMAALARPLAPDVVIGLPTLGLAFAPLVAEALGHSRFVPLGYSRKFWYDDALSVPVRSLTTPGGGKRVYLDPNQLALVRGRRAVVVDDAVSTGGTLAAVVAMLEELDARIAGVVVAMRQGTQWREALADVEVAGVFDSPRLTRRQEGWYPEETSQAGTSGQA
jgi:adenine/guanine phosphoribosyltransferase-like PRPP-binding protein